MLNIMNNSGEVMADKKIDYNDLDFNSLLIISLCIWLVPSNI